MPPKDAANPPSEEITGQSALPLSRIKKIIQLDEDIVQCSQNATFLIAIATEMFIQYLAEQGHNVVKSERKPRKTIQYKDLATAVSRIDNLEFLADVIPKTTTYKQFKEKKAKEDAKQAAMEKGQRTLNGTKPAENGVGGTVKGHDILQKNDESGHKQPTGPRPTMVTHASGSRSTLMVDRTVANPGHERPDSEDVEMED
ncbi:hypothetical protein VTN00DRAFT_9964 [Thermoascus crustaceus]|uniref:uncharacterized protein n=1 Tax=Thermoascus crustaceus TaxID=5088 RepID=UPI0037436E2C